LQRAHLRCESQPGASAHPLCPSALPAAWRQPAGQRPFQRGSGGFASARTFGANRSRGLPPIRYARPLYQPPGGSLRANATVNAAAAALPARAPSVRIAAGGFRPSAMPIRFTSRLAAACGPTPLSTRQQRPWQRVHLRCETQPGASAQPLISRKHSRPCCL
jgi:hypothetical protein